LPFLSSTGARQFCHCYKRGAHGTIQAQRAALVSIGILAAVAAAGADRIYSAIDLGHLPGGTLSLASAINNRAQVVGVSLISGNFHAFLWERGQMTDLGIPPGRRHPAASDINNHGQIVGSTSDEFAHAA